MDPKTKSIFITGDIANDYFLVKGERFYSDDQNKKGTHYTYYKGGAYLICEFLKEISETRKTDTAKEQLVVGFGYDEVVFDTLPYKNNGFVSVSQYEKEKDKVKTKTWRIDEFLGFGDSGNNATDFTKQHIPAKPDSDIFIIDDAGMDFSDNINKPVWDSLMETIRHSKTANHESFIIYKKSGECNKCEFFDELLKTSSEKGLNLLTILSINDVRKLDVKVSSGISWEQSALDLVAEIQTNDVLHNLSKSNYLVITFQSSGALFVVNNGDNNFEYSLIFDPEKMEGDDQDKEQGEIIGRMSFFTAAFASQLNLAKKEKHYKVDDAIKAGLTAVRLFYDNGYIHTGVGIRYPFKEVSEALNKNKEFAFSSAPVPKPKRGAADQNLEWSILIDNYSDKEVRPEVELLSLTALAKNIVIKGPGILKNIPSSRFGNLFTIDRSEIESLRNLKKIMETYIQRDEGKKPLSIGVFGPPGAGKSFAVEEIGKGILGDKFHMVTFNLSQFANPADIIGALHQVRDLVIKKKTPVIFWDEFDSQKYMWLQYLLAPMQDGAFQDGQINHPVGKCIFVFAGATSYSMHSFGRFNTEEAEKDFILKKGPDFISRLNGYINILGPNRRQSFNAAYTKEEDKWKDDITDLTYPVRRAIFIIGLLRLKKTDWPLTMDWGLLNALLTVDRYKHGSRSLANLLTDMKQNNPRNLLLRSWLPSKTTLELYFNDLKSFYKGLERQDDFLDQAYEIAPIIHSYWYQKLDNPTVENSVEYSFLPVFIKESNVQAAMRIPEVLKAGGFKLVRKNTSDTLTDEQYTAILTEDSKLKELMAKTEHDLWMDFYKKNGWEYAEIRNDYDKKHNCLKSYDKLPEEEKEKDRGLVSAYFKIVGIAKFGIVKL